MGDLLKKILRKMKRGIWKEKLTMTRISLQNTYIFVHFQITKFVSSLI